MSNVYHSDYAEKGCLTAAPLPPDMVEALELLDIATPDRTALQAML